VTKLMAAVRFSKHSFKKIIYLEFISRKLSQKPKSENKKTRQYDEFLKQLGCSLFRLTIGFFSFVLLFDILQRLTLLRCQNLRNLLSVSLIYFFQRIFFRLLV